MNFPVFTYFTDFTLWASHIYDYIFMIFLLTQTLLIGLLKYNHKNSNALYVIMLVGIILIGKMKNNELVEQPIMEHNIIIYVVIFTCILLILYTIIVKEMQAKEKSNFELPTLILLALLAMFINIETTDLLVIFIALEIQAFIFYTIINIKKENLFASEGGLKYFIIGALASIMVVIGTSFLYEITASTNLLEILEFVPIKDNTGLFNMGSILILIGLLSKIGGAPFHLWLPDAYQGAPFYILIFLAIFPKIFLIYLLFIINTIINQDMLMVFVAITSGIIGAVQAILQMKIKRFLAYTIIYNNAFFVSLLVLSKKSVILLLLETNGLYLLLSFGLMTILYVFKNHFSIVINSLRNLLVLKKSNVIVAFSLLLAIFSSAGIPPFLGFFQKYIALYALVENFQFFLVVFLICSSIIPAYYYLRIAKIMFLVPKATYALTLPTLGGNVVVFSFFGLFICLLHLVFI